VPNDRGGPPRRSHSPRAGQGRDAAQGRPSRPPAGPRAERADEGPELPDGITGFEVDPEVAAELRTLSKTNSDVVAKHLVAAALLLDDDPEAAYAHAVYARSRASRVGSVREAVGIAAYASGRYAEALSELRAVRRIHGSVLHLPVMADCQRGLGRPERALEMAGSPEASQLDAAGQVEMRIVAAGARQDLEQYDAAVLTLECPQLRDMGAPWAARLRYAYAEALIAAGRREDGLVWMSRAAEADTDAATEAAERLAELEGVVFIDVDESSDVPLD
jgi:tetratricopeptide (TPR) repeat protein